MSLCHLRGLDAMIRSTVRCWLKLPKDVHTSFFYAHVGDGGLGLANLEFAIPIRRTSRMERLCASSDPVVRAVALSEGFRRELEKWAPRPCGGELATTGQLLRLAMARQLHSCVDGKGLRHASAVPEVHQWVDAGPGNRAPAWAYISALKCRLNALPTKARLSRGRPQIERK